MAIQAPYLGMPLDIMVYARDSLAADAQRFAWLRQRLLNRRHRRAIERLEGELHRLRSLPLVGGHGGRFEEPATGPSVGRG